MNVLDIILLIVLVLCVGKGLWDGVIKQVASLAAVLLGIWFAKSLMVYIIPYLKDLVGGLSDTSVFWVSYIIAFILIILAVRLIGALASKLADLLLLGWINRLLGGAVGAVKALMLCAFVFYGLQYLDPDGEFLLREEFRNGSVGYPIVKDTADAIFDFGKEIFSGVAGHTLS